MGGFDSFATWLRRAWEPVAVVIDRYWTTTAERGFLRQLRRSATQAPGIKPVVLVETIEDDYYLALFALIVRGIEKRQPVEVHQFVSRSLRPGSARSPYHALKSLLYYNRLTDGKWVRLYAGFCNRVAYRSVAHTLSWASVVDLRDALRIWRNLKSKESLVDLTVSGIRLGDLVYDTYLRFRPRETVNLKSLYLWVVIWQALRDLRAARAYMLTAKPQMLLTNYSCYVQHGVAVRVALSAGVKVITFGNYQSFYKQLLATDWAHTPNPEGYRTGFSRLENAAGKIAESESALAARVAGKIDPATAYMQRSAYAGSAELPPGISGSLVLFLHDFFDSPHCYQWMIFPDFCEWATFTLDLARRAGIKVFVKPHPNQIENSKAIVAKMTKDYPEVTWLSSDTSNVQLAEAGAACAVTVYGTVAHEMAYLGVPSIAAGHNPHIAFGFSHTARSREEYARLIENYQYLRDSPERLRRESLEFYCMHNLQLDAHERGLRDLLLAFRALVTQHGGTIRKGSGLLSFAQALEAEPAYHRACGELAALLHDTLSGEPSSDQESLILEQVAPG
jgi:hypothetical protein